MFKKNVFIPDFVKIQRSNFQRFLNSGITSEINIRNPIVNEVAGLSLVLYPQYYQLCPPENTIKMCIVNGTTYACKLYVPAQLLNKKTGISHFQWILLTTLPLMNNRGHFILNGSPRVIINQMVRSPGVYYAETIDRKGRRTIYGDLISQRGTWLRFEMDSEAKCYVRMKRTPKIPIPLVLEAMGFNTSLSTQRLSKYEWFEKSNELGYQFDLLNEIEANSKRKYNKSELYTLQEWALVSIYALTHPKRELVEITPEMGKKFLFRKFLNPRTYDLGYLGRVRLNKKFNLSIPESHRILTAEDIFKIVDNLSNIFEGNAGVDDIDHLKNRRIRASGELIQNQFAIGLTRFEKIIRERLRRPLYTTSLAHLVTTKPINAAFREFFGSSQLSQFLDQTNPLAEITHKRRFTSLGPSGVSRETAGMAIRSIHPTHYGRICPIETPEGQNAGLVNSPTTFTRINENGFLESPFYKVFKGQVQASISYLTADQEEEYVVAPGDIPTDHLKFLGNTLLPGRINQDFSNIKSTSIQFLSISSLQMISVATSLIPFLEHDDANRALMGSNMQRQAVPLIKPEKPIVGTGYEARVVSDSGHVLTAKFSGYVTYVSSDEIRIYSLVKLPFQTFKIGMNNQQNPCIEEKNNLPEFKHIELEENNNNHTEKRTNLFDKHFQLQTITYKLEGITRSNQDTLQFEKPLIKEGQWVEKGDVIADGSASSGGQLALGKNILIGYVPWEGYNFEDAILISERLVQEDLYTSLHVEKHETIIKETRFGEELLIRDIPDLPMTSKRLLDEKGIIKLGSWVREGDVLVGKVTPINRKPLSPHERLLYDIVGKNVRNLKDTSLRVPKGLVARVVSIRLFDTDGRCYEKKLKTSTPLGLNKKNNQDMKFDFQQNSMLMGNQKNIKIGFSNVRRRLKQKDYQLVLPEFQTKDSIKVLSSVRPSPSFKIKRVQILLAEKRRIQVGDKVAGRHGNKGIVSRILPQNDMPYLPDGRPLDMVLNPLGVPSRMNVGQVYECLLGLAGYHLKEHYKIAPFDEIVGSQTSRSVVYSKLFKARTLTKQRWLFDPNYPGKVKLFDGRTGEPFDQRVMVGQSYILKLVHQVDEKIHARSTGPYSLVTQQPLRGRSKHGGQRLGEMEVWALEGFGAAYILQELLTVKSDDMKGRHQVMDAILTNVRMQLGTPESFKVLVRELQSLCLDIGVFAITEKGYRRQVDILRLP